MTPLLHSSLAILLCETPANPTSANSTPIDPSAANPTLAPTPTIFTPNTEKIGEVTVQTAQAAKSIFQQWFWKPMLVILVILSALIVRWLASRAIKMLINRLAVVQLHPRLTRTRSGRLLLSSAPMLHERRNQRLQTLGSALRSLVSFLIAIIVLMVILQIFRRTLTPAWISAGVVTAVVGFGAQQLIRDFLTGVFLIIEDQYGVGDAVDIGTVSGTVEAVGLRLTQIRDDNGVLWHVRNGEIVRVGNKSQGFSTTTVAIPLHPETDVEQALQVLTASVEHLCAEPEWSQTVLAQPTVTGPDSLSAQSMMFNISVKTAFGEGDTLASALRTQVNQALRASRIRLGTLPLSCPNS